MKLTFTEFDVDSEGSLARLFAERDASGIYWLDFADGGQYIRQSRRLS